jgi:Fur family iron response transcriptional regulator
MWHICGETNRMILQVNEKLRDRLMAAGVRPTPHRLDLAGLIFADSHRHFTVDMIYAESRSIPDPPSLATTYNTINEFVRRGLLLEIGTIDAKTWYDTDIKSHRHFYFEDGGEVTDIPPSLAPELSVRAPKGKRVSSISLMVRLTSR